MDNIIKQINVNGTTYDIYAKVEGLSVNDSGNLELNAAAAGAEKVNLVSADAIQIKTGSTEEGDVEPLLLDCELGGENCNEYGVKVCNGLQNKATRVVGLKLNCGELIIDTQKANTTKFDTESIDIKYRYDKKDHPIYVKLKARAFDFRCYNHGGIALQPAGEDNNHHENKIKFESDRETPITEENSSYQGEGGKGFEFGTFNNLHTSIFTNDYRFNKDANVYAVTRKILYETSDTSNPYYVCEYDNAGIPEYYPSTALGVKTSETPVEFSTFSGIIEKADYMTLADDFKDIIADGYIPATWEEIVEAGKLIKALKAKNKTITDLINAVFPDEE